MKLELLPRTDLAVRARRYLASGETRNAEDIASVIGSTPQADILLVDHALTRTFDKGAVGIVSVSGDPNPEIFEVGSTEGATASPDTPAAVPEGPVVTMVDGAWTGQPSMLRMSSPITKSRLTTTSTF